MKLLTPRTVNTTVLLIIIFHSSLFAQFNKTDAKLDLSPDMKEPSNATLHDYIGEDDANYFLLREKNKRSFVSHTPDYILESHNKKSFGVSKMQEISPQIDGDDAGINQILMLNGQLYALISYYSKKKDQLVLYVQPISKSSLQLSGAPKQLMMMPVKNKRNEGSFNAKISRDRKTVAIFGFVADEKQTSQRYNLVVMDDEMKVKWQKEIMLPYDSKLFATERSYCDNDGNAYVLGRLYKEMVKEKRSGEPNYVYKMLAYREDGESFKEYTLSLKDNFITDMSFGVTDDGKLICAGFYSARGTFSIKGTYCMQIDVESGDVLKEGTRNFDPEFLEMFRPSEKKGKDEKEDKKEDKNPKKSTGSELVDFDLDDVIPRSDGGAVLIAEQYYVSTYTTSSYNSATKSYSYSTHYVYHYNHIIAVNVNADLQIDWAVKIPKVQASEGGKYYLSYTKAIHGDKIYFIFNDNEKNLAENDPKRIAPYDGRSSIATLVTLRDDGSWKKSYIFSNKSEGVILRPVVSEQINEHQVFLYAEKGKNYMIGTLTF
ncbi:MAG: hypothetical protein ABIQ74_06815 [Chitinophagales bacterium]